MDDKGLGDQRADTPPTSPSPQPFFPESSKRRKSLNIRVSSLHLFHNHQPPQDVPSASPKKPRRPKNLPITNSLNPTQHQHHLSPTASTSTLYEGSQGEECLRLLDTSSQQPPATKALAVACQCVSRIFDFLYLGSSNDASNPLTYQKFGVTDVINLTTNQTPPPCHVTSFLRIAIDDNQKDSLLPHLPSAVAFIEKARERGGVVLVHCLAGVSRSATLVIAYLICHHHMSFSSAYQFVKNKRPIIAPNFNFLGQLVTLERQQRQQQNLQHQKQQKQSQQQKQTQQQPLILQHLKQPQQKQEQPQHLQQEQHIQPQPEQQQQQHLLPLQTHHKQLQQQQQQQQQQSEPYSKEAKDAKAHDIFDTSPVQSEEWPQQTLSIRPTLLELDLIHSFSSHAVSPVDLSPAFPASPRSHLPSFCCNLRPSTSLDHSSPLESFEIKVS